MMRCEIIEIADKGDTAQTSDMIVGLELGGKKEWLRVGDL
jgi:hypothetical protein